MTTGLQKAIATMQSSMLFREGNVNVEEKKVYVLKITDMRGEKVDIDIPASNDKEVEIFLQGFMSANWLTDQIHTR